MIEFAKARLSDIEQMQAIVADETKEGIILPRDDNEVATNIRSYTVAKENGNLIAYAALHIHSPVLAEIRSLIVGRKHRGRSIGKKLVLHSLDEARDIGLAEVLVLTYSPDFFRKLGFEEIPKETIPDHKIWADCIKCIHFPTCNEISLVYTIDNKG